MNLSQRTGLFIIFFVVPPSFCYAANVLEFEPGAGIAAEYTDNAKRTPDNAINDVITTAFVGAQIAENDAPLTYEAATSFKNRQYIDNTYADKNYFNLAGRANWELIRERFNFTLTDNFNQRKIDTLDADTPDNTQNSNAFVADVNIGFPITGSQSINIRPTFSQYYYEVQPTNNKQYALALDWNYQMYPLTAIGLIFGSRKIDYTEKDAFGNSIADTTFTNVAFVVNTQRLRSTYAINLGATSVNREGGGDSTGFTGYINWLTELSSRSRFQALASTALTDTSSVVLNAVQDPINGNPNDVQISTDVIRNTVFNMAYMREDGSLNSRIWTDYREVTYSDSPQDRIVRGLGANLNYPLRPQLAGGIFVNYNNLKQLNTAQIDELYVIGGNLNYQLSRMWNSTFNATYRTKQSTNAAQEYDEFSVLASLVYGFAGL